MLDNLQARACSRPTSTTRRSIRSIATCSRTTAWSRCRAASAIRIARARSNRASGHAQKTPLKGLRFETLEEAQAYLDRWETRWADTRIHGTTKRQVAAMFAEERPAPAAAAARALSLLPLRQAHRASRWLRRGRGRVLRRAARLDRPAGARAVGRPARAPARPDDRAAPARAPADASAAGIASRTRIAPRGRRPSRSRCSPTRRHGRRPSIGAVCPQIHADRRRAGRPAHPRRPRAREEARRRASSRRPRKAALEIGRADLSLRPPLSRRVSRRRPSTLRQVDPLIRQLTLYRDLIDRHDQGDPA